MARNHQDQETVRKYLLRQLTEDEQRAVEERLLVEDDLFQELAITEDEVIDEYLAGELSEVEVEQFEQAFLTSPERQNSLKFARALKRLPAAPIQKKDPIKIDKVTPLSWWRQSINPARWSASPLALAALVLIAAGVGFFVWRSFFYQSDVDKGLVALNEAFREQRPVEARLTQLDYAPFAVTRGADTPTVNESELRRAELTLLDAVREHPGAASYHALGKFYLARKEFSKATENFAQALKAEPNNPQIYSDLGAALLEQGKLEIERGKSDQSSSEAGKGLEDLGRSVENLNKALELDPNLLEPMFNRALCYQYMMLFQQAADDWREYLKKDSSSQWAEEARRNLVRLREQQDKTSETKERLLQDFLSAYETGNDDAAWLVFRRSRARTGNLIVEALLDDYLALAMSGRLQDANDKLKRISYAGKLDEERAGDFFTSDIAKFYSLATRQEQGFLADTRAQMKVANEHFNRGEFEQAIDLYSRVRMSFAEKKDIPESLFAESWVGYSRLRIPQTKESAELFEGLLNEFESHKYGSLLAQSLHALADAHATLNEFSKALHYAKRGQEVAEKTGDPATTIRCLGLAVSMQLILSDYRQSLDSLNRAVSLAGTIPPEPKLTWPLYYEAALNFHFLGLPASALAFEQEALRLADASGVPLLRSRTWERLGVIYGQQKKYSEAIECGRKALAEAQNISGELSRKNISAHSTLVLGQLNLKAGNFQDGLKYFDQSLALNKDLKVDAYSYQAHKGKLLALMALNDNATAETELGTVLHWFEENRAKIAEESYRNKFFDSSQNTYDVAVDFQYSRKKDAAKAFDYAEAYRARSLLDLITSGPLISGGEDHPELMLSSAGAPLTLTRIQERLPNEVQLLEYAVLDDKLVMWVITRDGVRSAHSNISRNELAEKTRRYLRRLSAGRTDHNDEVIGQAKELYSTLIGPVESYLNSALQLCIVPDGDLNFVPFAALISPVSGRYLVEDFTLGTSPSATIFITSSEKAKRKEHRGPERLLIVGNPAFDRQQFVELPDLPGAEREAETIGEFYAATPLTGNEAVAGRVKRLLKDADIAHFATHAIQDERSPLLSKLLLSRDGASDAHHASPGFLQASEIYGMSLPRTGLVVLSACQTSVERAYRGEGAIGFARPFIAAGVPLVIASLWPVESEGSANLMISFHKHRKQDHLSTVEALRRAQLEFIHNQQPTSQNNYGWAAFIAIGGYAVY